VSAGLFRVPEVRGRFHTLELGASESHDGAALGRLMVRHAATRSAGPNSTRVYSFGGTGDTDSGWSSHTWRIWWEPPSRWRADVTHPGSPTEVFVVRDDASLAYFPMQRALYTTAPVTHDGRWEVIAAPTGIVEMPTIDVFQLFHSPLPASEWVFATVAEEEIYNGRMTRRVRATRRTDTAPARWAKTSGCWLGVDEYECLVDDELRILMRLTGIADGVPVGVISADDVRVDAPLPADIFDFIPPPGTRIAHIARAT
jgi:hypothetical protein